MTYHLQLDYLWHLTCRRLTTNPGIFAASRKKRRADIVAVVDKIFARIKGEPRILETRRPLFFSVAFFLFPRYPASRLFIILFFSKCSPVPWLGILFRLLSRLFLRLSSLCLFLSVWPEKLPVSDTRLRFNYSSNFFSLTFLQINDDLLDCSDEKNRRAKGKQERGWVRVGRFCPVSRVLVFDEATMPETKRKSESFNNVKTFWIRLDNGREAGSGKEGLTAVHYAACRES